MRAAHPQLDAENEAIHRRQTASDRPGVAQPVPLRPVPAQPWNRIFVATVVLFALLLGAWEWHWRNFGAEPHINDSDALWAIQRRRIDNGEGNATVIAGASRVFFDIQLDVWQKLDGERPIQLAMEGSTPIPVLEDLADDPKFTGRLIVGVAPELFFSGWGHRGKRVTKYTREESPYQHVGQWLSSRFIEPYFAFDDPDYALATVLKRLPWPDRPGKPSDLAVRKLAVIVADDRAAHMWSKVENDPAYRALARRIWTQDFNSPDVPSPEELAKMSDKQIALAVKAVNKLRARGVKVLFVRAPSFGPYLEFDNRLFPRKSSWDVLLAKTGAPGIHFRDYPQLQGFWSPEWSHLARADAKKFSAALYRIISEKYWPGAPGQ